MLVLKWSGRVGLFSTVPTNVQSRIWQRATSVGVAACLSVHLAGRLSGLLIISLAVAVNLLTSQLQKQVATHTTAPSHLHRVKSSHCTWSPEAVSMD